MTWGNIHLLSLFLLLPLVVAVLLWGHGYYLKARNSFYPEALKEKLGLQFSKIKPIFDILISLIILFFIILALLRPQHGFEEIDITKKGIDLYVLVDTSRSMRSEDIKPSRMERAKRKLSDLLEFLGGDRIGLIPFAGSAFVSCPLTSDYDAYQLFISELDTDTIPVPGTNLEKALNLAIQSFGTEAGHAKAILLITDGEQTYGNMGNVFEELRSKEIKLYVMGMGTIEGAPIPDAAGGFKKDDKGQLILSRLEEESLKKLASEGNGAYVRSTSAEDDIKTLVTNGIRRQLKEAEFGSSTKRIPHEYFQIPLFIAVLFFAIFLINRRLIRSVLAVFYIFCTISNANAASITGNNSLVIEQYNAGTSAYNKQDYENAKKYFLNALNQASQKDLQEKILYNLGNTQYRLQDNEGAIQSYSKVLEINSQNRKAELNKEFVEKQQQEQKDKKDEDKKEEKNDKENENNNDQAQKDENKNNENQAQENKDEQNKEKQEKETNNKEKKDDEQKSSDLNENKSPDKQDKDNKTDDKQDPKTVEEKNENPLEGKPNDLHNANSKEMPNMTKDKAIYWLESIDDSPKEAIKQMLLKEKGASKKVDKDW
ncbi:VWA domain-containing protein [bacterium]|nr:VWA domain-containing protein [bacterium]